jgi:6-phosphofructokinase 1
LGWEVVGFIDGYEGMLAPIRYQILTPANTVGILSKGGTILGTTNKGRFVAKAGHGEKALIPKDVMAEAKQTLQDLKIEALVCIGGDGSLTTADQLFEEGVPVVGVPKTIDNDLSATAMTFGFDSAVQCVVDALDRLRTTASSHKRVMVLEVMGRYAGWIALHGGLAGGADAILIPEIPFSYDVLSEFVKEEETKAESTLIVVGEGAFPAGGDYAVIAGEAVVPSAGEKRLGGIGSQVAAVIAERTGRETRTVVLGHLQRGGAPTTLDRILGTRFGVGAVRLIEEKKFGQMVSYHNYLVGSVSIKEAVGQLKRVPTNGQMVDTARAVGISFGN